MQGAADRNSSSAESASMGIDKAINFNRAREEIWKRG